jgi:hypothetical protein
MLFNFIEPSPHEVDKPRRASTLASAVFKFKGVTTPPPPKPTPPPPTTNDAEVRMAREESLRQSRMRGGRQSTIIAGGINPQNVGAAQSGSGAGKTVLG